MARNVNVNGDVQDSQVTTGDSNIVIRDSNIVIIIRSSIIIIGLITLMVLAVVLFPLNSASRYENSYPSATTTFAAYSSNLTPSHQPTLTSTPIPAPAFINGYSIPSITVDAVNLQVCANNLSGKTVYVQMWRDAANGYPAHTWNYSLQADGSCVTFFDMDGPGPTFANVDYYTVAALEPLGSDEATQQRTSCYDASGHTRLCDKIRRN